MTLTPGMGMGVRVGGAGGHLGPPNSPKSQKLTKTVRAEIVHTSGTFSPKTKNYLLNMFINTEKETGSDKRIKNINLKHKRHQQ